LKAGLTGGAEAIVIPEVEISPEEVAEVIRNAHSRGKTHSLVVIAEGAKNNAEILHDYLVERQDEIGFELRTTILGHVQRGGKPTAFDRMLGTRLGAGAIDALAAGEKAALVGWRNGAPKTTPYETLFDEKKELKLENLELARILAQ
jgi:6-phosphofructokinase 1